MPFSLPAIIVVAVRCRTEHRDVIIVERSLYRFVCCQNLGDVERSPKSYDHPAIDNHYDGGGRGAIGESR